MGAEADGLRSLRRSSRYLRAGPGRQQRLAPRARARTCSGLNKGVTERCPRVADVLGVGAALPRRGRQTATLSWGQGHTRAGHARAPQSCHLHPGPIPGPGSKGLCRARGAVPGGVKDVLELLPLPPRRLSVGTEPSSASLSALPAPGGRRERAEGVSVSRGEGNRAKGVENRCEQGQNWPYRGRGLPSPLAAGSGARQALPGAAVRTLPGQPRVMVCFPPLGAGPPGCPWL